MTALDSGLTRTFVDLPNKDAVEAEDFEFLRSLSSSHDLTWGHLLEADRVLIVSEAGAGKTHECKEQQTRLFAQGEPAFYLELASLANSTPQAQLDEQQRKRLERWWRSQNERAVFFLDSIDELRLTAHSFAITLRQFANALGDHLDRACIVLTTRPGTDDRVVVERELPIRQIPRLVSREEAFADVAMRVELPKNAVADAIPRSRYVGLAPLDEKQMRSLAIAEGVTDPGALLAAVEAAHAEEFTKRPLDFIDLCAAWKAHGRIRGHRDQLESSIAKKLTARTRSERKEVADLTPDKAREGAERLALAALMTRNYTLWHDAESGRGNGAALDPLSVLPTWTPPEIQTLLERALFGFATYGRVRFHNRSAIEYLAACRLQRLKERGLPMRTLHRLLFADSPVGLKLVRPTMQPIAAWLAPQLEPIRNEVLKRDPSILLRFGDPGALQPAMRAQALELYVQKYGIGGWRGLHVPALQARRLASAQLAPTITKLWSAGIESLEVRETLLDLIEAGHIAECADIAFDVAVNVQRDVRERLNGLQALAVLDDGRLPELLDRIATQHPDWPSELARLAVIYLFPSKLSVPRLLGTLRGLKYRRHDAGGVARFLPDAITRAALIPATLEVVRQGLTDLVAADCHWDAGTYRLRTGRQDLVGALRRVCELQVRDCAPDGPLAESIALVLQLSREDDYTDDDSGPLRALLAPARASLRSAVFWAQDQLLTAKMIGKEAENRLVRTLWSPSLALDTATDLPWLETAVSDARTPPAQRRLALDCLIQLLRGTTDGLAALKRLRPFVSDAAELTEWLEEFIQAVEHPPERPATDVAYEERRQQRERKQLKARASWLMFWRELSDVAGKRLEPERAANSAYNLVEIMSRVRGDDHHVGWNRAFLEQMFDKGDVERLRDLLIDQWRKVTPTLPSERPEEERNWYYSSWRVGVIGIFAEAEEPGWARRLTPAEAQLAMRYALTAINGLPAWVEPLAQAHPDIVHDMLRPELELQLGATGEQSDHSSLLQYIGHAGNGIIDLFLDAIRAWLAPALQAGGSMHGANKFERAIDLLLTHGNAADAQLIRDAALQFVQGGVEPRAMQFWLPLLMRLSPDIAVAEMEALAESVAPARASVVTEWLGALFGHHARDGAVTTALLDSPELLHRLALLTYRHIRIDDDLVREGVQRSSSRSNAEFARSHLSKLLFEAKGASAWEFKLKFSQDPLAAHFKDRVIALAEEAMAQEWDSPMYQLADVAQLERIQDVAPVTRVDMAALLLDRLDELADVLRRDATPRKQWAAMQEETDLRRAIGGELAHLAKGAYVVSQEQVTGEEKETDLRLVSTSSPMEAVIELKVGDKPAYSVEKLMSALRYQLVGKYMAPEARRVGCLLISIASGRQWKHPQGGHLIGIEAVIGLLQEEADQIVIGLGFESLLEVRMLDLRPVTFR